VQDVGDLLADPRTQYVQLDFRHIHPLVQAIAELHLLHQLLLLVAEPRVLLLVGALFDFAGERVRNKHICRIFHLKKRGNKLSQTNGQCIEKPFID